MEVDLENPFFSPEFYFAWDTFKKVFVFVVIALSAAGIHKIVEILEHNGIPYSITYTLTFVEYAILLADVVWFVRVLIIDILQSLGDLFTGGNWTKIIGGSILFLLGAALSPYLKSWLIAFLRLVAGFAY